MHQTALASVLALLTSLVSTTYAQPATTYDLVVYGGTSAGVAAAIQAQRMGHSVVLIEPTKRIGGLTTGGLGQTDIGNKGAIGGIAREFYQRLREYYEDPSSWNWQRREQYRSEGQSRTADGEDATWTFEPSAALKVYQLMLQEAEIQVVYNQRLNRQDGVTLQGARIYAIAMESGKEFHGRVFIDATYEGDLMAAARVDYAVGRESNQQYGETLNGVQVANAVHHQFFPNVDPHVVPGDPNSGLLPLVEAATPGEDGTGDKRVQAYCFRMCMTDHPDNRIPFHKPASYDPQVYELLLRNFEAGEQSIPLHIAAMPNRKTDTNNNKGFSTDFIGQNYEYPEASYERREEIAAEHLQYQQGLMWTLANHPRVPVAVRQEVARWGMCKDEFQDGNGWQQQLYIREARRMRGAYVMTQHNCQGHTVAEDSIGLAAYTMDSHNVQRYVDEHGSVRNEGDVQVGGFSPYPISYRSLTPKQEQCTNLLVPVCLSATHISFGSIRMEPVFMVLGQSAATAACQAIEADVDLQAIDYGQLRKQLITDKQILSWESKKTLE